MYIFHNLNYDESKYYYEQEWHEELNTRRGGEAQVGCCDT